MTLRVLSASEILSQTIEQFRRVRSEKERTYIELEGQIKILRQLFPNDAVIQGLFDGFIKLARAREFDDQVILEKVYSAVSQLEGKIDSLQTTLDKILGIAHDSSLAERFRKAEDLGSLYADMMRYSGKGKEDE